MHNISRMYQFARNLIFKELIKIMPVLTYNSAYITDLWPLRWTSAFRKLKPHNSEWKRLDSGSDFSRLLWLRLRTWRSTNCLCCPTHFHEQQVVEDSISWASAQRGTSLLRTSKWIPLIAMEWSVEFIPKARAPHVLLVSVSESLHMLCLRPCLLSLRCLLCLLVRTFQSTRRSGALLALALGLVSALLASATGLKYMWTLSLLSRVSLPRLQFKLFAIRPELKLF